VETSEQITNLYGGYQEWKGWNKLFISSLEENAYFEGETRGLAIRHSDVLEIGFGSGSFLAWAKAREARIAGIEINPRLLEAAHAFGVETLPPAFENVAPSNVGRFDTIVAFDVFEHFSLDEIISRLKAIALMLRPGGNLILRFPNAQSPFGLAPQNGDSTHKARLSRTVFQQLLFQLPFEIIRYEPAYRNRRGGGLRMLTRTVRYIARDTISTVLNFVYSQDIPWDPVVVLVLKRIDDIQYNKMK
jgi:SAM-dependent methyltransferase